jgi:hypothetical protein
MMVITVRCLQRMFSQQARDTLSKLTLSIRRQIISHNIHKTLMKETEVARRRRLLKFITHQVERAASASGSKKLLHTRLLL